MGCRANDENYIAYGATKYISVVNQEAHVANMDSSAVCIFLEKRVKNRLFHISLLSDVLL